MDMGHSPLEPLETGSLGSHFTKRCQHKAGEIKKGMQDPARSQGEQDRGNILVWRKKEENGTVRCSHSSEQNISIHRTSSMKDSGRSF